MSIGTLSHSNVGAFLLSLVIIITVFMGCITADISTPSVCYKFPFANINSNMALITNNIEPNNTGPTYTFKQTLNILNTFNEFDSNQVSVVINSLNLGNTNGDMSWISTIDIYISTKSSPSLSLLHYTLTEKDKNLSSIDLYVRADTTTLDQYLSSGTGTFLFILTGTVPITHPVLNATICFSARELITKKIL